MFIINITYKVKLDTIDKFIDVHIEYLKKQYSNNVFIASGRKVPRTGGVILSKMKNKEDLINILNRDLFKINDLADYEIVEFILSMTSKAFKILKE